MAITGTGAKRSLDFAVRQRSFKPLPSGGMLRIMYTCCVVRGKTGFRCAFGDSVYQQVPGSGAKHRSPSEPHSYMQSTTIIVVIILLSLPWCLYSVCSVTLASYVLNLPGVVTW